MHHGSGGEASEVASNEEAYGSLGLLHATWAGNAISYKSEVYITGQISECDMQHVGWDLLGMPWGCGKGEGLGPTAGP